MNRQRTRVPILIRAFCVLLLGLFCFQAISEYLSSSITLGVVIQEDGSKVRIIAIRDNSPAQKAGVPAHNTLKAINGHAIQSVLDVTPLLKETRGHSVTLTLDQNQISRDILVTPGVPANYRSLVLNFLILVIYISIGIAAIKASGIDSRTRQLAWFSFAVALDITTYINISYWPGSQILYIGFKQMLAVLQFALLFHLLSMIPKPAPWMKLPYMPAAIYILSLSFHFLWFLLGFNIIFPGSRIANLSRFVIDNNVSFISWGLIVFCVLVYQYFTAREPKGRQQVKWILLSIIPWIILQLSDLFVPNTSWVYSDWYALADKFTHMLLPVGILATIFSYNLLDLSDLFPRKFFYSLLATAVLAFPGLAIVETGIYVSNQINHNAAIWLSSLAMLALGYTFSPLRDRLIQLLEGRSWYKQHHLGRDLRKLAEELTDMDGLEEIERQLTSRLASLMHSQGVVLHLNPGLPDSRASYGSKEEPVACWIGLNSERICLEDLELSRLLAPLHLGHPGETNPLLRKLYRHGLELIVPLHLHGEHLGTLMIGRSLGRHRYSWRETELLNLFAQNISAKFANALLHSQLQFDELTGLYRRKAILERLEQCIQDYRKTAQVFSIAMIDLDDFKMVNDRHGHLEGDRILIRAAATAREMLSKEDRLGRYGGEEFLLVMPGRDAKGAAWLCEHVRWAMEDLQHQDGSATTVSIGIAEIREASDNSLSLEEQAMKLIALADKRLYKAKAEGKNRISYELPVQC
ncbi:GGDEF domain-containing protein [Thiolapillus brandeum]|uniref:GGDEF domain-containing protein n=1 Tax=Thiolapillus brandeum TaxID=1076588 RepID=UPI000596C6EA|nr:diguanylate cyclase [Thiolapillus brandeum]